MRLIVSFFALVFFHLALKAQTGNQARNGVVINVKDFGAKGDGKDNDYKAIQKGIAELHRIGSGILYFPKGTYRINEVFRLDEKGKVLNGKSHFFLTG